MPRNVRQACFRNMVWTWFDKEAEIPERETAVRNLLESLLHHRCSVWQLERCPSTGRVHWQGYTEFSNRVRGAKMCDTFPGIHIEKRKGTRQQARDYCEKEESRLSGPWECGDWADLNPGRRSDLEGVRELLRTGADELTIADAHFGSWCRYRKSFAVYRQHLNPERSWKSITHVYWGLPGGGEDFRRSRVR